MFDSIEESRLEVDKGLIAMTVDPYLQALEKCEKAMELHPESYTAWIKKGFFALRNMERLSEKL